MAPFILEVMMENGLVGGHYVEPYAGGAGIAVDLLLSGKVARIHLNDSCEAVFSFWHSILNRTEEFCRRISCASLTVEEWRRQKGILASPREHDRVDLGFSLFYLNRCNRSGILSGGLIGGLRQDGRWKMDARFPKNELIRRIELIAARRRSIALRNWDAERFIRDYIPKLPEKAIVYCDPPYFHKAHRLYSSHYQPADHIRIAQVFQDEIARPWIVSYDNAPEITALYSNRRSFIYDLQYNAARAYKGKEVVVISDKLALPASSVIPWIDVALGESACLAKRTH